jgi:hypothetical protein
MKALANSRAEGVPWERLERLATRLKPAAEGTAVNFVELVAARDRDKAPVLLKKMIGMYPKLEPWIRRTLTTLGDREMLEWAIATYNAGNAPRDVGDYSVLQRAMNETFEAFWEPAVFQRLHCQPEMPGNLFILKKAVEQRLPGAYEFLEQVYNDGKGQHLAERYWYAQLFGALGDPRGERHVRTICETTDSPAWVAWELGAVMFPKRPPAPPEMQSDPDDTAWNQAAALLDREEATAHFPYGYGRDVPTPAQVIAAAARVRTKPELLSQYLARRVGSDGDLRSGARDGDAFGPAWARAALPETGIEGTRQVLAWKPPETEAAREKWAAVLAQTAPSGRGMLRAAAEKSGTLPEDATRQKAAIIALGNARDAEAITLLSHLAENTDPAIEGLAIDALGQIGPPARQALQDLKKQIGRMPEEYPRRYRWEQIEKGLEGLAE